MFVYKISKYRDNIDETKNKRKKIKIKKPRVQKRIKTRKIHVPRRHVSRIKHNIKKVKIHSFMVSLPQIVFRDMGYQLTKDHFEYIKWRILWMKQTPSASILRRLKSYQKVNYVFGIVDITHKDRLIRNILKAKEKYPAIYNFTPPSWCLPADYKSFMKSSEKTYIMKPNNKSCAMGISLFKNKDKVKNYDGIVQKYIDNPLLISGYKFDLRVYIYVRSIFPLKIYMYNEGLVRMCTHPYSLDLKDRYAHFTNTSVNGNNQRFIKKHGKTYVESFAYLNSYLRKRGRDTDTLWKKIGNICLHTINTILPKMRVKYKEKFPNHKDACFAVVGFDIMLDKNLKPWLLETNSHPSYIPNNETDYKIKYEMLKETIQMLDDERYIKNYTELTTNKS